MDHADPDVGPHFAPDRLAEIGQAFDYVWASIAPSVEEGQRSPKQVRDHLACTVLKLAQDGQLSSSQIQRTATRPIFQKLGKPEYGAVYAYCDFRLGRGNFVSSLLSRLMRSTHRSGKGSFIKLSK